MTPFITFTHAIIKKYLLRNTRAMISGQLDIIMIYDIFFVFFPNTRETITIEECAMCTIKFVGFFFD